jgi:ubiquinone biosynthesis protein
MLRAAGIGLDFLSNLIFEEEVEETETQKEVKNIRKKMRGPLESSNNNLETEDFEKNASTMRAMRKALAKNGGILTKISQILSADEEDTKETFENCKPFNLYETTEILKDYINRDVNNIHSFLKNVNYNNINSGSIGLIFEAWTYDDKPIILKVLYDGLYESAMEDLKIIDKVTKYVYTTMLDNIDDIMGEIKETVSKELKFEIEAENHNLLYNLWKDDDDVFIPKMYLEYCNDKVLIMDKVNGHSLGNYLNIATKEQKNKVARTISKFIFTNLYKYNILWSDIHTGNIIIDEHDRCHFIDFGCIHNVDSEITDNLRNLYDAISYKDDAKIIKTSTDLKILHENVSAASKEYFIKYISYQYYPWTIDEVFHFTPLWMSFSTDKDVSFVKEWKLPKNLLYFNKLPFSLYHLLAILDAETNFCKLLRDIIYLK